MTGRSGLFAGLSHSARLVGNVADAEHASKRPDALGSPVTVSAALLVDVSVGTQKALPGWDTGVRVYTYVDHHGKAIRTTGSMRATDFAPVVAPYLEGCDADEAIAQDWDRADADGTDGVLHGWETRFHRALRTEVTAALRAGLPVPPGDEPDPLAGVSVQFEHCELLRAVATNPRRTGSTADARVPGILAAHLEVTAPDLDAATRAIDHLARDRGEHARRGDYLRDILEATGVLSTRSGAPVTSAVPGADSESTVYQAVLVDAPSGSAASGRAGEDALSLSNRALYGSASGQGTERSSSAPEKVTAALKTVLPLSPSWRVLVLRHGTAFQLTGPADDEYRAYAPIYFRTIYTDALMLGRLQGLLLRVLEMDVLRESAPGADDDSRLDEHAEHLTSLSRELLTITTRYWMRGGVSNTGRANEILRAYWRAAETGELLDGIRSQLSELSELAERDLATATARREKRLEVVLAILGAVIIPVGPVIDLFSWGQVSATWLHGGAMALTILLLCGLLFLVLKQLARGGHGRRE